MSVTLHLGDCLDVMRSMPDGCVDAVVTDPPFKISQEYSANADPDNLLAVSSIWVVSSEIFRLAKPGSICAMFYDTRILPLALHTMTRAGWKYLRGLTFYRRWGQASLMSGWMSTSDFILIFVRPGARPTFHGTPKHDVYIKECAEAASFGHPAQKPIEAVAHLVGHVTPPGGTVLDPFMGSGTTGVACIREGRSFIGIEREPEYYAIAEARIAHARGETPVNAEQPALPFEARA